LCNGMRDDALRTIPLFDARYSLIRPDDAINGMLSLDNPYGQRPPVCSRGRAEIARWVTYHIYAHRLQRDLRQPFAPKSLNLFSFRSAVSGSENWILFHPLAPRPRRGVVASRVAEPQTRLTSCRLSCLPSP